MKLFYVLLVLTLKENINAFRVFDENGGQTILALENENIKIECKTDVPMTYCGFIHPTGKRFSFSGPTIINGQCSIKIKATVNDSGMWRCHIGRHATGVEVLQTINLRVVGQVAAVKPNVTAVHGKKLTIACATTKGLVPLSYCRFEPPVDMPFSIDSKVKESNPILERYYFPENKSLDRGDCAVTIRKVKYEDVGSWTCGAGLDDGKEHTDVIKLDVEGLYTMSTASATGITFGVIAVAGVLIVVGLVAWKKRRFLGSVSPDSGEQEMQEMRARPSSRQSTPQRSPQRSPQSTRYIPKVTIESPSEPSASPLVS